MLLVVHIYGDRNSNDRVLCSAPISEIQAHFWATDPELFEQPDKIHGRLNRFSRDRSRRYNCQVRFSLALFFKFSVNPRFAIRSLHLEIKLCTDDDHDELNKAIRHIPTHLPDVQRLYIHLDMDIALQDSLVFHCTYQLGLLPLKEIVVDKVWTFTQCRQAWFGAFEKEYRWCVGHKREYGK